MRQITSESKTICQITTREATPKVWEPANINANSYERKQLVRKWVCVEIGGPQMVVFCWLPIETTRKGYPEEKTQTHTHTLYLEPTFHRACCVR